MSEDKAKRSDWNRVIMTAIIVGGIIALTCILSFVAVAITYISNASWL
jgi:Mg/Co/Ni transporter MgtE